MKYLRKEPTQRTRKLNPKWGLFGFFGFLGFTGFFTYHIDQTMFPFIFFSFFGFFGFYFEGKMSNTFMDERFRENALRAQLYALKTGFSLVFLVVLSVGWGLFAKSPENCAVYLLISLSLICALTMFLSEYLLYKYDHEEEQDGE